MKMNLVNKLRETGSNLGRHVKQHGVKYVIITTLVGGAAVFSGCGPSQEDEARIIAVYEQEKAEQEKALFYDTQVAKIPGIEEQMEILDTKIDTTKEEIFTKMDEKIDPLQEGIDTLLEEKEQKDTERYDPSHTWRHHDTSYTWHQYDGSHTWHKSTPYKAESVNEIISAVRIHFPKDVVKRMRQWDRSEFQDAFPHVKYQWLDGNTSNGELEYGIALHVDEVAGKSRAYLTNGTKRTSNISVWEVEDFLERYFNSHTYDISKVTIQTAGHHHH